jgi:hypothetical protein
LLDETGEVKIEKEEPATATRKERKGKPFIKGDKSPKLYLFGVNRGRLVQIAKERQLSVDVVDNLNDANLFVTSKSYYRRKMQKVREAEAANMPIYVLRSNTPPQIRRLLSDIYPIESVDKRHPLKLALNEAEEAVTRVKSGEETVELSPRSAYIRRLQHLIAERHDLSSQSTGKDPDRRVRIYKE